jgi:hypothetical protein
MKTRKTIIATTLMLAGIQAAQAGTAYFKHEVNTGGMTKQCVYDYLGSTYVITVSSVRLCPLTIEA